MRERATFDWRAVLWMSDVVVDKAVLYKSRRK
jgi:hypothetical protein